MNNTVLYEKSEAIVTITLNRPEKHNTLNFEIFEEGVSALAKAADDPSVRVVILTGAGRSFCAGGDLGGMSEGRGGDLNSDSTEDMKSALFARALTLRQAMQMSQLLRSMSKATIAAINGACAGAGLALACACDLRFCAETAVFNTAFLSAGRSGDFGATWLLPRIVGSAKAREYFFLSQKFNAAEAHEMGLVSRIFPADELIESTQAVAVRLAEVAPIAFAELKANLNESETSSFSESLDSEAKRQIRCGMTEDAKEAASAFLEKRAPVFHGR